MTNTKKVLLLIHGFPLDHTLWEHQIGELQRTSRVLAPDLRGFGGSEGGPGAWTMENFAQDLLRHLDGIGVERFIAVGHSMGGYVVFAIHRLAPKRLAGIGLVASRAGADTPEARARREETAKAVLERGGIVAEEQMVPKLFAPGAPLETVEKARAAIRRASRSGIAAALRGMACRPDATIQLPEIHVPVMIIAGRQDSIVPPAESEAMARMIPDARLVWAERSGHMPMLEEPQIVNSALAELVEAVRA
ncbi:MAG: alpha/beta hydrolase [Planctomycetes bacterium]|nr:alpha/beta hydrolase [Planctomycetota bacterium]